MRTSRSPCAPAPTAGTYSANRQKNSYCSAMTIRPCQRTGPFFFCPRPPSPTNIPSPSTASPTPHTPPHLNEAHPAAHTQPRDYPTHPSPGPPDRYIHTHNSPPPPSTAYPPPAPPHFSPPLPDKHPSPDHSSAAHSPHIPSYPAISPAHIAR